MYRILQAIYGVSAIYNDLYRFISQFRDYVSVYTYLTFRSNACSSQVLLLLLNYVL